MLFEGHSMNSNASQHLKTALGPKKSPCDFNLFCSIKGSRRRPLFHIHLHGAEFSGTPSRTAQRLLLIRPLGLCAAAERITDKDWKWRLSVRLKSYSPLWQGGTFGFICLQEGPLPEFIIQSHSRKAKIEEGYGEGNRIEVEEEESNGGML